MGAGVGFREFGVWGEVVRGVPPYRYAVGGIVALLAFGVSPLTLASPLEGRGDCLGD